MDQLHDSYHSKRDITITSKIHIYHIPTKIHSPSLSVDTVGGIGLGKPLFTASQSWNGWKLWTDWLQSPHNLVCKWQSRQMYDSWILSVFHAASVTYTAFFIQKWWCWTSSLEMLPSFHLMLWFGATNSALAALMSSNLGSAHWLLAERQPNYK